VPPPLPLPLLSTAERPAITIPIFRNQTLPDTDPGLVAIVRLPAAQKLAGLDRLELDMTLSCQGTNDSSE
jgi:hypothetical protein